MISSPASILCALFTSAYGTPFTNVSQHSTSPPFICVSNSLNFTSSNLLFIAFSSNSTLVFVKSSNAYSCPSNSCILFEITSSSFCSSAIRSFVFS